MLAGAISTVLVVLATVSLSTGQVAYTRRYTRNVTSRYDSSDIRRYSNSRQENNVDPLTEQIEEQKIVIENASRKLQLFFKFGCKLIEKWTTGGYKYHKQLGKLVKAYITSGDWAALVRGLKELLVRYGPASKQLNEVRTHVDTHMWSMGSLGHVELVSLLLCSGFPVNTTTPSRGSTMLHGAVFSGKMQMARLLLLFSADVNHVNSVNGETPLMLAAQGGRLSIVKLLLKHGAAVNAQRSDGKTTLMRAVYGGYIEVVKHLVNAGAIVDTKGQNNETALDLARKWGYASIVTYLESLQQ